MNLSERLFYLKGLMIPRCFRFLLWNKFNRVPTEVDVVKPLWLRPRRVYSSLRDELEDDEENRCSLTLDVVIIRDVSYRDAANTLGDPGELAFDMLILRTLVAGLKISSVVEPTLSPNTLSLSGESTSLSVLPLVSSSCLRGCIVSPTDIVFFLSFLCFLS